MDSKSNQPSLIVVVGETASGKSDLAVKLAERFGGEVICADSWTVRKGVDIGTAKPSEDERRSVPHHLLDIVEPCDDFNAAVFKELAIKAIEDIASRGKLPIMVGGTGLYVDSVMFDYSFLPAPPKGVRSELNALTIDQLLSRIRQNNISLDGIDVRNKRRLIRLLESGGQAPKQSSLRPNTLVLGLKKPRDLLESRIKSRVDSMLVKGLEHEVATLSELYGWDCEALKGIGYREWKEYFENTQDLNQVKERIIKNTQALAKRQRTWFKRNKHIHWICNFDEGVDLVTSFVNK